MEDFFAQFVREWKYLQNVSPFTIAAHRWAWDAFLPVVPGRTGIVKADALQRIPELREALGSAEKSRRIAGLGCRPIVDRHSHPPPYLTSGSSTHGGVASIRRPSSGSASIMRSFICQAISR